MNFFQTDSLISLGDSVLLNNNIRTSSSSQLVFAQLDQLIRISLIKIQTITDSFK